METEPKRPAHELVFQEYFRIMRNEADSNTHTSYVSGIITEAFLGILTRADIPDEYLQRMFLQLSTLKDEDGGYLPDKPAFLRNIDQLLAHLAPKD